MKHSILLMLFLTSTMFVSGQTYRKFKSSGGSTVFQKSSNTTAILRFENVNDQVITMYLTLSSRNGDETLWTSDYDDDYVITKPASIQFTGMDTAYEVTLYNALDRKIWSVRVQ